MILAVRSAQDPRSLTSAIRREISSLDPDLPAANVRTLEQVTSDSIAPRRLSVVLISVFAGGRARPRVRRHLRRDVVPGRATHARDRCAHGARRAAPRCLPARGRPRHAVCSLIGTAIGLLLAFFSSRALGAMLYNVAAVRLPTFALVTFALALVALLASYIPAQRATRADPMIALGHAR